MSRYWGIRVGNGWGFKFTEFTSTEASNIVGMPSTLLGLWRGRGQVSGGRGNCGTFDARQLAELMIKYELSKCGVSPSDSAEVSCKAAQIALFFALLNSEGTCEAIGTQADTQRFIERFSNDTSVAAMLTAKPELYQFLVVSSDGNVSFHKELTDGLLALGSTRPGYVISLQEAARDLATGARRPLFTVDVSGDTPEPIIRQVTCGRNLDETRPNISF